jgi:hypothetical protein
MPEQSAIASKTVAAWRSRTRIPFTCKSGNEVVLREPRPTAYLRAKRLPLGLSAKVAKAKLDSTELTDEQKEDASDILNEASRDEKESFIEFTEILVSDVLVCPRVAYRESGDNRPLAGDEVLIDEIPPDDYQEIFEWASRILSERGEKLQQERKIQMGEAEVKPSELGSFRSDAPVSALGADGGEVRAEAVTSSAG